ncbi:O-antigen ligase family protein [Blastopirellula sp. JC732]|uniref:O-antigen ligase family protein n=1 Tax=Blastopirellula sediminis TaxID=2894196 RepID=A0A9X1MSJ2_9BACT|nr:O-antigen ligase family protein [Blastopirellula sediminis]MCC9605403.1 O-antigen ligase family protein [Blastopirellula sediminis]MCC9631297.1 O-antigen ligase family protein [Blastopirellula sediminis]
MTAIYAILAIAGLLWGTIWMIRGSLLHGCMALLVCTSTFGVLFFEFNAGINLSIDRLALVGLVGAFIVQWKLGKVKLRPWMTIDYVIATLMGVIFINSCFLPWGGESLVIQHFLNGYLIPLTLYVVARNLDYTEKSVRQILVFFVLFGVYLAVTGVLEGLGQYGLLFPRYIADPKIGLHFGRARGPMVQSVSYGVYLSTCLLAVWILRDHIGAKWRPFLYMLLPVFLAAVFFTKTRTVWLGAGGSLLVVLWLTLQGRARTIVIASLFAVALLGGLSKMDGIIGLKREGTVKDTRNSVSMRASFAYVSWKMFLDSPIVGHGFTQFKAAKLDYLGDRNVDLVLESIRDYDHHNTFLSILVDLGIVGFIPFLAMYYYWARDGWTLAHRQEPPWAKSLGILFLGVIVISWMQMFGHEITYTPIDHLLIFCVAGMAMGIKQQFDPVVAPAAKISQVASRQQPTPIVMERRTT